MLSPVCHFERSEKSAFFSTHRKANFSAFGLEMTFAGYVHERARSHGLRNCHPERSEGSAFELASSSDTKADFSGYALEMTFAEWFKAQP